MYSSQKDISKSKTVTNKNVEKYLGILFFLTNATNMKDLWNPVLGIDSIKSTMSVDAFECLQSVLYFNDNANMKERVYPKHGRIFKLRPVVDHLSRKFLSTPMRETLSVDEQICATKTRHHMRQYNPRKSHK